MQRPELDNPAMRAKIGEFFSSPDAAGPDLRSGELSLISAFCFLREQGL